MIYLDNNATTRPSDAAALAADTCTRDVWSNPSSVHRFGQEARRRIELARESVALLVGGKPREIVFTSGGTEALHLAILGSLASAQSRPGSRTTKELILLTTRAEHAAVRDLAQELETQQPHRAAHGFLAPRVEWLSLSEHGVIDANAACERIAAINPSAQHAVLVLQWANNETGAIQPIARIGAACKDAGVTCIIDGTQWVGKMPTDVMRDGPMDFLCFAPHKFHGVKGLGVLWARQGTPLRPLAPGSQELGRRAGTENVPGIAAAGEAARDAHAWLADPEPRNRLDLLRSEFEHRILDSLATTLPNITINRPTARGERLWNTTNIAFAGLEAEAILLALSERGVCASAGAACSSGSLEPSPVLLAMGVPPAAAHGSVRFSLSRFTTPEELARAALITAECVTKLARSLPR